MSSRPFPAGPIRGSRIRLVLLYGGQSAEHEVSCISAWHVARAVDRERYDLQVIGITTGGRWVDATDAVGSLEAPAPGDTRTLPSPDSLFERRQAGDVDVSSLPGLGLPAPSHYTGSARSAAVPSAHVEAPTSVGAVRSIGSSDAGERSTPIVVLPLLHGPKGEDGTVQGLLEIVGLPYCGAGVAGSAAAMDKGLTKSLLSAAGLPQARYLLLREDDIDDAADRVSTDLGWPAFVKPANLGSSIGISKVADADGLRRALSEAARFDEFFVVEEAIDARELEIGVLGWPTLRTSAIGEIEPSHEFYDFEDKYLEDGASVHIPAKLPVEVADEMSRLAIAACRAVRVEGMARVDFFYEERGRGLLVNEINTIPGFTPISMYPKLWAASGVEYSALIDELVDQAVRRFERRARFVTRRT